MSLKLQQQQAAFARRREIEHMRVERTAAVDRYYDHWGKVTSRFENWTTPEYYKQAEDKLKQTKENKEKAQKLVERREKLQKLIAEEKSLYELEQREREKPRARRIPASSETLEKIGQNVKERENIKRKLELEAKLYGKWRHGVNDENLIFESKSDHEVLAKLNWLDKQIEDQLQREKEESISQERNLRLQQEISKTEQTQKERQQIREHEITEIRALQEKHMEQLKERQRETESLKDDENEIRVYLAELAKELELLKESSAVVMEPAELSQAYNLKRIKVFIRQRSEVFRNQIKLSIDILERMSAYINKSDKLQALLGKYKEQLEAETYTLSQIECMYESEAKYNLKRCEDVWQAQHLERYNELKQLLMGEQSALGTKLNENLQRQADSIEIRSTHLASIENSNEQLKQLMKEQEDSPRGFDTGHTVSPCVADEAATHVVNNVPALNLRPNSAVPKITNSFNNLNLDCWQGMSSVRGDYNSPRLQSQRSMQVVTPDTAERPKFGRKRVAWT